MEISNAQARRGILKWYEMMMLCYEKLPLDEHIEFILWDDNRDPGQRTSDWPGWVKYIGEMHPIAPAITEKRQAIAIEIRRYIFKRDNFMCVKCGSIDGLSIDHIKAFSKGGSDDPGNLRVLCIPCNSRKGSRDE